MLAISVIPFILHLMSPVIPELQPYLQGNVFAVSLTPDTQFIDINSSLTFTTKLGVRKLPVPLYAQLERSMTNRAVIYHQVIDTDSNQVKKIYFSNENCSGSMKLTEDTNEATIFQLRNKNDNLHGSNFDISCYEATNQTWNVLALVENTENTRYRLFEIIIPSADNTTNYHLLTGMITPYYMQNKL